MLVKFCKSKKAEKMLAIALIITMTLANILFLGKNLVTYALEENLENQGFNTQHENVKFDAYFDDGEGRCVHSAVLDATNATQTMNLYIAVKQAGYLKEAYVEFRDNTNSTNTNYEILGDSLNTTLVQNVNSNTKTLSLNYINNGTDAVLQIPIKYDFTELANINKLKQDSNVTLRGIYVNEKGKETEILKTVKLSIGWNLETELSVEQSITKYVPYSYNEETGLILQTLLKVKQNSDDKVLPVKATELKIKVPEINGIMPEKINVVANNTMATNGNKIEFTSDNWEYNEEEGTVTIVVPGFQENEFVWAGIGTDEYFVTYTYSNIDEQTIQNEIQLHCEAEGKMAVYSNQGLIEKTALSSGDVTLNRKVGDIVTYSIEAMQKELSKGRIYANYNTDENVYDTEYNTTIKVNVSGNELVNELYMNLPCDNFANEQNSYTTKINGTSYTKYKQLVINKAKMQKLLGEDGYINIFDNNSNVCVINNETQDVDGNYIVDLGEGIGELTVKTSKPVEDGILEINTTKVISKDLSYTKGQVKQVNSLKVKLEGNTNIVGVDLVTDNCEDTINLTETTTNAKLEISNTSLTSMAENKNVEMKIVFNNNVETSDLYKNPVFVISLPKYIEDIEITGGNILYTTGLEVDYVEKNNTDNGIVLTIYTKGAETEFSNGTFTNGTNIVLNTNIKVNMLTPNILDKIKLTYTNESVTTYANEENGYGVDSVDVKFVAPEEMVTFNTVLTSSAQTTSMDGNEQTAKLEILDSSKVATMKISILNKYSSVCNNIRILGRIPFEGNKEITTGTDLGTTFNTTLVSAINTKGINAEVYYSANENATQDLTDDANMWTTDNTNLENVKSYLIVLPDYEMKVGEILEFTYNCKIPEKLEHNESAYGTYVVYFDNVSEYVSSNTAEATKVGLTTGIGANIETSTKVIYHGEEISADAGVKEYQDITYRTTINNTGSVDATGVRLTSTIKNAKVVDAEGADVNNNQLTWNLGEIKAGQNKIVEYTVKATEIRKIIIEGLSTETSIDENENEVTKYYIGSDEDKQEINLEDYYKIFNNVNVTAENFEGNLEDSKAQKIVKADIKVEGDYVLQGSSFNKGVNLQYQINVGNLSDHQLQNIVITDTLPQGLKYIPNESQSGNNISYNEQTRTITIRINNIDVNKSASELIYLETELPDNIGKLEIKNKINVNVNNTDNYQASARKIEVLGPVLGISLTSNTTSGSYVREGNEIEFVVTATNTGEAPMSSAKVKIDLPEELRIKKAYYYRNGTDEVRLSQGNGNSYYALTTINPNESIVLHVITTAKVYGDAKEVNINVISNVGDINSNTLTYIIEKVEEPSKPNNPSNPTNPVEPTYKITGTAWLDENEDGIKDGNEKLLEGIDVMLIDANTGVIVTDKTNGTMKQVKTSNSGTYTFSNLPKGKYIVVFQYNSGLYSITEYKKHGATDDVTSKVIETKINKDGKLEVAGITDAIEITDSSKANINIGLTEKPKFDLSLEKTINRIVIQNSKGTSYHDFTNTKLAKVEIPGKYLNGSVVYVEYKITIKNEGEIAGYATKIVDYVDDGFTFVEADNPSWYKGTDGNLYSDALAKTIIQPGEKKELDLVLLKKMTENNTGLVSNKAEIYSSYNELNIEDCDSTARNNAQGEDDLDCADTIISIKTGTLALYITITLITITILATGIYFINKKVLKGGKI